jgi:hypothetical protein
VDAIQEFNLITQNASAEFGNYEGGVISATIKSGTNSFHGDAFEFLRNDTFDSNSASASWTRGLAEGLGHAADGTALKSELRYNQFGATFGGPILKNKLFFFADYQGQRYLTAGPTGSQLLTSKARAGDFSQLCTGGFDANGLCKDRGVDSNKVAIAVNQLVVPNSGGPIAPNSNCAASPTMYYVNPAQRPACGGANPALIQNNNFSAPGVNGGPYTVNSVAQNIFSNKGYPLPQVDSLGGNNYFFKSGHALNNDQGDLKIDYYLSEKDHFSGRWSQMDLKLVPQTGLPFAAIGDGGLIRGGSDEPVTNFVMNWTHTFRSNLLNEARFGFNKVRFTQNSTPTTSLGNISEQLGIAGANLQSPGLLYINIPGNNGANAGIGQQNIRQIFHDAQLQAEDNVSITHGRHTGRAGFQYVRLRQNYIYPGNNGVLGLLNINSLTGSGLADFWLGNVGGGSNRDTGGASTLDQLRGNIVGVYVQDDWRLTPRLTINLGLRFEDHTPLYEVNNRVVNFDLKTGAIELPGQNGNNRALYNNYLGRGDWLPRIGFAWSPGVLGGKTVVRGGYAISSFMEGGGGNEELTQNLPYGITQQTAPSGVGAISQGFGPAPNCPAINFSCYAGQRIRIFDQHFMPALTQQWNLTIQHQLTNSLTFQVGYVGQHGTHLLNFEDVAQRIGLNAAGQVAKPGEVIVSQTAGIYLGGNGQPCAMTPGAICGPAGSLFAADQTPNDRTTGAFRCCGALAGANMSNASQRYDALQAVLQKRLSNDLQGQVAYTYGKCMSDSPGYYGTGWGSTNAQSSGGQPGWANIYNKRADWGPCYFDQTHILSSYITYQLPVGRGKRFGKDMNPALNAVLGNWEIGGIVSFHTGNALTLNEFGGWGIGGDTSHTNGVEPFTLAGLPNCNGPIKILNKFVPPNPATGAAGYIQWFDPTNVSNPAPNTFGTCSVGNVRGPHYSNTDLSLHKDFLFTETKKLEFRFEGLNAFNHPVYTFFGGPANGSFDPSSANFGHFSGSQGARQLQFALKFFF